MKGSVAYVEFEESANDKMELLDIEFDDSKIESLGNACYEACNEDLSGLIQYP